MDGPLNQDSINCYEMHEVQELGNYKEEIAKLEKEVAEQMALLGIKE